MGSNNTSTAEHGETLFNEFNSVLRRCGVNDIGVHYDARLGVVDFYPFRFVHGYSCAQNTAKFHAEKYGGKCPAVVFGHTHYSGYWRDVSFDKREGYACSCLCDIDPDYAYKNPSKLRHSVGWIYGWYDDETGDYRLNPVTGVMKDNRMVFTATTKIKDY